MKKLGTFKLELKTKDPNNNIGKINELKYPLDKVVIKKESKSIFKMFNKKNMETSEYTGTQMSDQTAKYLLLNFSAGRSTVDVIPVNNWYYFKKDIKYKTKTTEEAEEELKKKSVNKLTKKPQKPVKEKEIKTGITKSLEDDLEIEEEKKAEASDDDRQFFNTFSSSKTKRYRVKNEDDELEDPEIEDNIPSDYEDFIKDDDKNKKSTKDIIKKGIDSEEDSSIGDNNQLIESEAEEGSSDEMEKDEREDMKRLGISNNEGTTIFLNHKRSNEMDSNMLEKRIREEAITSMEEVIRRIIQKNVQIKYEDLTKELKSQGYPVDNFQNKEKLSRFLAMNCKKFTNQNKEDMYYLK